MAELNFGEIDSSIRAYLKAAYAAVQHSAPDDPVAAEFKRQVEVWTSRLSALADLGNPALKDRHWEAIFQTLK